MRDELLKKIEGLGAKLPNNTLDQLIDELGGPSDVAEMTGRKMRLVQVECGRIEYQSRAESDINLDQINLTGNLIMRTTTYFLSDAGLYLRLSACFV
jgi:hypothetical protein